MVVRALGQAPEFSWRVQPPIPPTCTWPCAPPPPPSGDKQGGKGGRPIEGDCPMWVDQEEGVFSSGRGDTSKAGGWGGGGPGEIRGGPLQAQGHSGPPPSTAARSERPTRPSAAATRTRLHHPPLRPHGLTHLTPFPARYIRSCYEPMSPDGERTCSCATCGNHAHATCFDSWAAAKQRGGGPVTCVWCRSPWPDTGARARMCVCVC